VDSKTIRKAVVLLFLPCFLGICGCRLKSRDQMYALGVVDEFSKSSTSRDSISKSLFQYRLEPLVSAHIYLLFVLQFHHLSNTRLRQLDYNQTGISSSSSIHEASRRFENLQHQQQQSLFGLHK